MIIIAAANGPHSIPYCPRKYNRPTGSVWIAAEDEVAILAHIYSPQILIKLKTITVAIAGLTNGSITLKNIPISPQPSARAASISSDGTESKNFLKI